MLGTMGAKMDEFAGIVRIWMCVSDGAASFVSHVKPKAKQDEQRLESKRNMHSGCQIYH